MLSCTGSVRSTPEAFGGEESRSILEGLTAEYEEMVQLQVARLPPPPSSCRPLAIATLHPPAADTANSLHMPPPSLARQPPLITPPLQLAPPEQPPKPAAESAAEIFEVLFSNQQAARELWAEYHVQVIRNCICSSRCCDRVTQLLCHTGGRCSNAHSRIRLVAQRGDTEVVVGRWAADGTHGCVRTLTWRSPVKGAPIGPKTTAAVEQQRVSGLGTGKPQPVASLSNPATWRRAIAVEHSYGMVRGAT